jgi:hypothetical protein
MLIAVPLPISLRNRSVNPKDIITISFHRINQSCILLCLIMFIAQPSFAASDVVYKQPMPEKDLKVETKAGEAKEEGKDDKNQRYVYNPVGKTDPFEPFISKSIKGRGAKSLSGRNAELQGEEIVSDKEPETELEKVEISKLILTAVVRGKDKIWAMVTDPTGKGYFLEKGTKIGINSGFVDEIICEEKKTAFGIETVRKVIIKVPYRDRDRNIIYRSVEMEMPITTL